MADRLLLAMLRAGHKAANIARLCRAEESLFSILVQEKGLLKSSCMDFKTLADVFIQEVVKTELEKQFPGLNERVFGEENNLFTNTLGETITVEVKSTVEETSNLLSKVLDGNETASQLLAEAALSDVHMNVDSELDFALDRITNSDIDVKKVAFWIDPIDGTTQYVKGINEGQLDINNVYMRGLQCVTVLIGAYDTSTGFPIMSVINQPFYEKSGTNNSKWKGRSFWAISYGDIQLTNMRRLHEKNHQQRANSSTFLIIGSAYDPAAKQAISSTPGLKLCTSGGAGYKSLCVAEGLVDAYLYTEDEIYKWDTCAPQCLLMGLGGSVVSAQKLRETAETSGSTFNPVHCIPSTQLNYRDPNPDPNHPWANLGGSLAFTGSPHSLSAVEKVVEALSGESGPQRR